MTGSRNNHAKKARWTHLTRYLFAWISKGKVYDTLQKCSEHEIDPMVMTPWVHPLGIDSPLYYPRCWMYGIFSYIWVVLNIPCIECLGMGCYGFHDHPHHHINVGVSQTGPLLGKAPRASTKMQPMAQTWLNEEDGPQGRWGRSL